MLAGPCVLVVPALTIRHNLVICGHKIGRRNSIVLEFFFFFSPSHLLSSPFYSLSLLVVTQIRGHIAGSSPPLPTTVRALHFYREKISALSSLANSRRIVEDNKTKRESK